VPEHFAAWLDPRQRDPAKLLPLLRPYPVERMERRPVDRRVNSVKVDEPGLTAGVELPGRPVQPSLFDAALSGFQRMGPGLPIREASRGIARPSRRGATAAHAVREDCGGFCDPVRLNASPLSAPYRGEG